MPCEYADINVEPKELVFEYKKSSPYSIPKQYIKIRKILSTGTLTPRWNAEIETNFSNDWVTMSRLSGEASSSNISIGVKAKQKGVGEHFATIIIDSDSAENVPQYVEIKLVITGDVPKPPKSKLISFENTYNTEREVNKEIPVPGGEPEKHWFIRFIEWIINLFSKKG